MFQFDRIYRLTIGVQGKDGVVLEGKPKGDGLEVSFDIVKDLTQKTNKCRLSIRNLSVSTSQMMERDDSICLLEVGYSEDIGLRRIFVGYITHAHTIVEGSERITELRMSDGQIPVRNCVVSLSYADNVSRKKVIDDVAMEMGLDLKYSDDVSFTSFANGFSFVGAGRTCLDKICAGTNLSWSIQNNVLQVIKSGGNTAHKAIKLSSGTGLIGSVERIIKGPKKVSKKSGKSSAKKERKAGWRVKSLLQPTLSPGDLVYVESGTVKGWYKIESLRHSGSYLGSEWYTEMEVYEIK